MKYKLVSFVRISFYDLRAIQVSAAEANSCASTIGQDGTKLEMSKWERYFFHYDKERSQYLFNLLPSKEAFYRLESKGTVE